MNEPSKDDSCTNCGCLFKTKYMIKVYHSNGDNEFFQATSKKSIVGWIKHICNEKEFTSIDIIDLISQCQEHQEYYKFGVKQ